MAEAKDAEARKNSTARPATRQQTAGARVLTAHTDIRGKRPYRERSHSGKHGQARRGRPRREESGTNARSRERSPNTREHGTRGGRRKRDGRTGTYCGRESGSQGPDTSTPSSITRALANIIRVRTNGQGGGAMECYFCGSTKHIPFVSCDDAGDERLCPECFEAGQMRPPPEQQSRAGTRAAVLRPLAWIQNPVVSNYGLGRRRTCDLSLGERHHHTPQVPRTCVV